MHKKTTTLEILSMNIPWCLIYKHKKKLLSYIIDWKRLISILQKKGIYGSKDWLTTRININSPSSTEKRCNPQMLANQKISLLRATSALCNDQKNSKFQYYPCVTIVRVLHTRQSHHWFVRLPASTPPASGRCPSEATPGGDASGTVWPQSCWANPTQLVDVKGISRYATYRQSNLELHSWFNFSMVLLNLTFLFWYP